MGLTRRATMLGALATAAAAQAETRPMDVIIIGAGLAGLSAALDLEAAGAKVLVLEAQDRPGGRLRHESGGGLSIDVGGIQIGTLYDRVLALCRRFGIEVRPQSRGFGKIDLAIGKTLIPSQAWAASPINRTVGTERDIPPYLLEQRLFTALSPFETVDQWLDLAFAKFDQTPATLMAARGVSPEAIRLIDVWMNAPGARRSSALHLFRETARAAGRPKGPPAAPLEAKAGMWRLPAAMAAALKTPVRTGAEVVALEQGATGVQVRLRSGEQLLARQVICAAPLHAAKTIAFDPPLPKLQAQAFRKAVYAPITHVHLVPTAPFWEADGLSPTLYSDGPLERVLAVEGQGGVERIVVWLNGAGAWAADKMAPADLMAATLARLARLRPASAGKVRGAFVYSWGANRFAGGIRHVLDAGQAHRLGPILGLPHGHIRFAGEHTREGEHGMEAAVESGQRAAAEILAL